MHPVERTLSDLATLSAGSDVWQPLLFAADDPETPEILERLLEADLVRAVHDTLGDQLRELMDERRPDEAHVPEAELDAAVAAHLEGRAPFAYGSWVYYPWALRLVHVLPEAEHRELRTVRNRNKITAEEQARLAGMRIAIAGLSVGQATAITLAMEGVGGLLRLADFDRLSTANLNRLRAGVHDLGLNKALLTARAIYEHDPYARVEVLPEGVTDENLEAFLDGMDVLVEEADDLFMKVRLREAARRRGIAVFMETNDRGMLDVERFDLEGDRPLLHGRLGGVDAEGLRGLAPEDKVPIVLGLLGEDRISPRLAASLVEVGDTLKSWPQLASGVSLGAGIAVDAIRRSALGELTTSGRFYVDLERLVRPSVPSPEEGSAAGAPSGGDSREGEMAISAPTATGDVASDGASAATVSEDAVAPEVMRRLAGYGVMAPSGGNCQPWRLVASGRRLRCLHDRARSASFLDHGHRATFLAFGALAENVALAAGAHGLGCEVVPFPEAGDPDVVCDLVLSPGGVPGADRRLYEEIARRETNRRLGARVPLDAESAEALTAAAEARGGRLHLLTDPEALTEMGRILGRGDRVRFLSKVMHSEMMGELRWSTEEAERTRDGMDVATLELTASDLAGMRLTRSWRAMELVGRFGGGGALEKISRRSVDAASAMALLTVPGRRPEDAFTGGRALERVWLEASARGLAFQPMTALHYLFDRLAAGGEGLSEGERAELTALRRRMDAILPSPEGHTDVMLFRLARVERASVRALRRPVEDVLTFA